MFASVQIIGGLPSHGGDSSNISKIKLILGTDKEVVVVVLYRCQQQQQQQQLWSFICETSNISSSRRSWEEEGGILEGGKVSSHCRELGRLSRHSIRRVIHRQTQDDSVVQVHCVFAKLKKKSDVSRDMCVCVCVRYMY